jgi:hypothetical protein
VNAGENNDLHAGINTGICSGLNIGVLKTIPFTMKGMVSFYAVFTLPVAC